MTQGGPFGPLCVIGPPVSPFPEEGGDPLEPVALGELL